MALDGIRFNNIAVTSQVFALAGGKYAVSAVATWGGGSAKLQIIGPDLATPVSVSAGTDFAANGCVVLDLPPGNYQFTIATATGVSATVVGVPEASDAVHKLRAAWSLLNGVPAL